MVELARDGRHRGDPVVLALEQRIDLRRTRACWRARASSSAGAGAGRSRRHRYRGDPPGRAVVRRCPRRCSSGIFVLTCCPAPSRCRRPACSPAPAPGVPEARRPPHARPSRGRESGPRARATGAWRATRARWQWRAQPEQASTHRSRRAAAARARAAWIAWDDATLVPRRIALEGLDAPGVIDSSDRAAAGRARSRSPAISRCSLPALRPTDFVLVGNHVGAGLRSVGFAQTSDGRDRRRRRDQLPLQERSPRRASRPDAWPHVPAATPARASSRPMHALRAQRLGDPRPRARSHLDELGAAETLVVPLLVDGALEYREVGARRVDTHAPRSRWTVYVDAGTGAPVARRAGAVVRVQRRRLQRSRCADPMASRLDYGAPFVDVVVDGRSDSTDGLGVFPFAAGAAIATNSPVGPFVELFDSAGPVGSAQFTPQDGSAFVWNAQDDEFLDAQLSAYVHASRVKQYVRPIAPDLPWLDGQICRHREHRRRLQRVLRRRLDQLLPVERIAARTPACSPTSSITSSATRCTRSR